MDPIKSLFTPCQDLLLLHVSNIDVYFIVTVKPYDPAYDS